MPAVLIWEINTANDNGMAEAPAGFRFGGGHFKGSASQGVRGRSPPDMGVAGIFSGWGKLFEKIFTKFSKNFQKIFKNFRKILKVFLRKLLKMPYFSIFLKNSNPCVKFLRPWTKNTICWRFLRKFPKIFKFFLTKIAKNALF